ncbi:MAG: MarR family transcriptional regulator [Candidatus Dormiibacterota bacterium]
MNVQGDRLAQLLAALATALADRINDAAAEDAGAGAMVPAALTSLQTRPASTIDGLRRVLGLTHSATVRLVDRLAERDLVRRTPGRDRRSVELRLTPAGSAVAQSILDSRLRLARQVLGDLDAGRLATLTEWVEGALEQLPAGRREARTICRLCDHSRCTAAGTGCPVDRGATVREA